MDASEPVKLVPGRHAAQQRHRNRGRTRRRRSRKSNGRNATEVAKPPTTAEPVTIPPSLSPLPTSSPLRHPVNTETPNELASLTQPEAQSPTAVLISQRTAPSPRHRAGVLPCPTTQPVWPNMSLDILQQAETSAVPELDFRPLPLPRPQPQIRRPRPAYVGNKLPIPSTELLETKPFSLATPCYSEAELSLPRPYNQEYPHPLTVYASAGVNPATVDASGYRPLLAQLASANPSLLLGTILAECGKKNITAPALTLEGPEEGCGIPEKYWLRLSAWAGVKVPLGAVIPCIRARGIAPPRFGSADSPLPQTATRVPFRREIVASPVSPLFPHRNGHGCSWEPKHSRSEDNLKDAAAAQKAGSQLETFPSSRVKQSRADLLSEVSGFRRGSLPEIRNFGERPSMDRRHSLSQIQEELLFELLKGPDSPKRGEQTVLHGDSESFIGGHLPAGSHCEQAVYSDYESSTAGHLPPRSSTRRPPVPFDVMSTLEETEDETIWAFSPFDSPPPTLEPIGAEKLQRQNLSPSTPATAKPGDWPSCSPERPSFSRRSSANSTLSSRLSIASSFPGQPLSNSASCESFEQAEEDEPLPITPGYDFCANNRSLPTTPQYQSTFKFEPPPLDKDDAAWLSPRRLPNPPSCPPSRSTSTKGMLPEHAWTTPSATTTLDFSTGKSIWS